MDSTTMTRAATALAAALLVGLVLFQLALAVGVPWGRASYGGASAHLPTHLRVASVVAATVWTLALLVILRRAGHPVWSPLPLEWLPAAVWALVGLMVIACVANAATPSAIERAIWLPVSGALLASLVTIQLSSR